MANNVQYRGIGCFTVLGIVLITLKLAEVGQVATWSWWWVLMPFWIQAALVIVIFTIGFLIALLATIASK